jgi:hypothetical protein
MHISITKVIAVVVLASGVGAAIACGSGHPGLGGGGNGGGGETNACSEEGAVQACHINLGAANGVTQCAAGTQVCKSGLWTACTTAGGVTGAHYGGNFTSSGYNPYPASLSPTQGGLKFLADPIDASQNASLCQSDPCDPYCWGWDDEAAAATVTTTSGGASGTIGSLPGSWQAVNQNPCNTAGDCQFDQCCPTPGSGACTAWATAPATGTCNEAVDGGPCASTPDYTVEVGCTNGSGDVIVNVCNRGTAAPVPGTLIPLASQDDKYTPTFPFNGGRGFCTINTSTWPMAPGTCVPVNLSNPQAGITCNSVKFEKQNTLFVNGHGPGTGSANNATDLAQPECSGANNWGAINQQTCGTNPDAGAGGGTLLTCVDAHTVGSLNGYNVSPCHPGSGISQCQFDECCYKNGSNDCRQWGAVATGDCDPDSYGCDSQINYTVSAGCTDGTDYHLQVCNRGGANVTSAGGNFYVAWGASTADFNQPNINGMNLISAAGGCQWDWANIGGLGANGCVDLNITAATVNGVSTGVTCSGVPGSAVDVLVNAANDMGVVGVAGGECSGRDNWSIITPGLACSGCPATATGNGGGTYTYTATCSSGYRAKWQYLAYNVTTGGEVEFNVNTQTTLVDGAVAPISATYLVADPPNAGFPTSCAYGAASPCPDNLTTNLGTALGKDAWGNVLTLSIVTHDAGNVLGWSISYDCVPYE